MNKSKEKKFKWCDAQYRGKERRGDNELMNGMTDLIREWKKDRMNVWMNECMYEWMNVWVKERKKGRKEEWTNEWVKERKKGRMEER